MKLASVAGILFVCAWEGAIAAPFTYSESLGGDLVPGNEPLFQLSVGVNQISGNVWFVMEEYTDEYGTSFYDDVDFDAFNFFVPADSVLSSVSVEYSASTLQSIFGYPPFIDVSYGLQSCGSVAACPMWLPDIMADTVYGYHDGEYTFAPNAGYLNTTIAGHFWAVPPPMLESLVDLPGGTYYNFYQTSASYFGSGQFDYTITINVASLTSVPVPPSVLLLVSGLAGLTASTRRTTRSVIEGARRR